MTEMGVTVSDFAKRTLKNLQDIEDLSQKNPKKHFEVTQLVNSFVGLLVFPEQESLLKNLPKKSIEKLNEEGWKIPDFEFNSAGVDDLKQLARRIRNSICHFNIDFRSVQKRIVGVYFWDRPNEDVDVVWLCYFSIEEIRDFVEKFSKIATNIPLKYEEKRVADIREGIKKAGGVLAPRSG